MRRIMLVAVLALSGCDTPPTDGPENLMRVREVSFAGRPYLTEYARIAQDREITAQDGAVMRVYGVFESVAVSRGTGPQFTKSDADRAEAQRVAVTACEKLGLVTPLATAISASFAPQRDVDNAEWRFEGICTMAR